MNADSLIFAFLGGHLPAYDKNTLEKIDGKEMADLSNYLKEVLYFENRFGFRKEDYLYYDEDRNSEVSFESFKNGCWTDKKTKLKFTASSPEGGFLRENWIYLFKSVKSEIEQSYKDEEYFLHYEESGFIIHYSQIDEIQDGLGAIQAKDIVLDSLFKKSEVDKLIQNISSSTLNSNDELGISERETWLKIILLLSYSLALELQGDEADLLNQKGKKKISPDKLASWLKNKANEMWPGNDSSGHRCGKTTIDKILKEGASCKMNYLPHCVQGARLVC